MDFLAADGSCDVGSIPITAGHVYVHAAMVHGRVVFARISKPHYSRVSTQSSQPPSTGSAPPPSTTPSGTTAAAPCVPHAVAVTVARQISEDMTGSGQTFRFRNTSEGACSLRGYPRVQVLNAQHQPLAERFVHATMTPFGVQHPVTTINLAPGASASAFVYVRTVNSSSCGRSYYFYWRVGIDRSRPNAATDMRSANVVGVCGDAPNDIILSPYFR